MKLTQLVVESTLQSYSFDGLQSNIDDITTNGQREVGDFKIARFNDLKLLSMIDIDSVDGKMVITQCPKLTDISRLPVKIRGSLVISDCGSLHSLHGINDRLKIVGGNIVIAGCNVKSHVLGLLLIKISGAIYLDDIDSCDIMEHVTRILNRYKDQGRVGILAAQRELNDLGLTEYAQS